MLENENVKEENNDDLKDLIEVENSNVEILVDKEVEVKEEGNGLIFFKRVLSGVIDQIIVIAVSLILLLVFNLVLKLFGFYISEREQIFFILYVIVNVIYAPICMSTKLKKTIGSKINF